MFSGNRGQPVVHYAKQDVFYVKIRSVEEPEEGFDEIKVNDYKCQDEDILTKIRPILTKFPILEVKLFKLIHAGLRRKHCGHWTSAIFPRHFVYGAGSSELFKYETQSRF